MRDETKCLHAGYTPGNGISDILEIPINEVIKIIGDVELS